MSKLKNTKIIEYESVLPHPFRDSIKSPISFNDASKALNHVCELYTNNVNQLRNIAVSESDFTHKLTYPYIGIHVKKGTDSLLEGAYGTTVSHTDVLHDYYQEQFRIIIQEYGIPIWIGLSNYPISLTLIDEDLSNIVSLKKKVCPSYLPCINRIQGGLLNASDNIKPLSAFHGERIGYSLNRLHHYCGTDARFFQNTVIFVNYQMYVEFFIEYAKAEIDAGNFEKLIGPGLQYSLESGMKKDHKFFNPQMPAYHLIGNNRSGITLINVNVGPSNVKTITDHIAVLRSHRWIMLGHCAGLRQGNQIGDYVIAHNYLRYDYVLDSYIPKHVPIPTSSNLSNIFLSSSKKRNIKSVYTGTVVTTCDRNWELNPNMVSEFSEAKAIGIDMESATLATNAFRFGVESLSFLCISDMPLHGAPKLRSMASRFYMNKVREHFDICMDAATKPYIQVNQIKDDSIQYSHGTRTPFR